MFYGAIDDIPGVDHKIVQLLAEQNISSLKDFLTRTKCEDARRELAKEIGVASRRLTRWVESAELMQISGVSKKYIELLNASGVRSVRQLRSTTPDQLAAQISSTNRRTKSVRRLPNAQQLNAWIASAA